MTKDILFEKIENLLNKDNLIVCISGRSCSGKTTLANEIKDKFKYCNPLIICQDDWYKDLRFINRDSYGYYDMENEMAFEVDEFKEDILNLIEIGHCFVPYYNVSKNQRDSKGIRVEKSSLIILEGLHTVDIFKTLDNKVSVLYVLVDTSLDVCVSRRMDRDSKLYGIDKDRVYQHYTNVIDRHYKDYLELSKQIVGNKGSKGGIISE